MADNDLIVDARGHRCPVPTLRLRKALENTPSGAVVRLLADDPLARIDVPHFAGQIGATILDQTEIAGVFTFRVTRA